MCIPCHRRKLKCDKGQPCSRCTQSGSADSCVYQPSVTSPKRKSHFKTPEPQSLAAAPSEKASDRLYQVQSYFRSSDGKAYATGTTHWAKIACEVSHLRVLSAYRKSLAYLLSLQFEEAVPFLFGCHPQWEPRYRELQGLGYLFRPQSPSNFPFSPSLVAYPSQATVIGQLPPRQVAEALVRCYFRSFEVTHRLFHPMQFWDELGAFWSGNEAIDDVWLSQLCMVLALGCQAAPDSVFQCTEKSSSQWTESLLESAQTCFRKAPPMVAPTLTTIRTLCMMVLAEMLELVKGTSPTQVMSLMGFLSRQATAAQLHRTTTICPLMSTSDAEMRRRIWVTIQLLDVDVAMRAGSVPLCREHDADAPLEVNERDVRRDQVRWAHETPRTAPSGYTDGTFQSKLARFLPVLAEIIDMVNSTTQPSPEYDTVLSWDERLSRIMKDVLKALSLPLSSCPNIYQKASVQSQLIEVLSHRAKLALHHSFIRAPYDPRFDGSYRTVKGSSLWLLGIQEAWTIANATDAMSPDSRSSSPSTDSTAESEGYANWLVYLCHDDFDAAMLYLALILRRESVGGRIPDGMLPPTDMAWTMLRQGLMNVRQRACRSLQCFKEFVGLTIMTTCLQCLGNPNALLPTLLHAADHVEQTITAGMQAIAWIGNGPDLLAHEVLDNAILLDMDPELLNMHI